MEKEDWLFVEGLRTSFFGMVKLSHKKFSAEEAKKKKVETMEHPGSVRSGPVELGRFLDGEVRAVFDVFGQGAETWCCMLSKEDCFWVEGGLSLSQ